MSNCCPTCGRPIVADKPKRNTQLTVFMCAGCDGLAHSYRNDALACSPSCRVKAKRNGNLQLLREMMANDGSNEPERRRMAQVLQMAALDRLCPELGQQMLSGEMTYNKARPLLNERYEQLITESKSD